MLLPRKWALSLGLLAAVPTISVAGPFDFAKKQEAQQTAPSETQRPTNNGQNQKVAEDIAKALGRANLEHKDVSIEFKSGVAKIGGQIKNEAQRAQVTRLVGRVPGVQTVENGLSLMDSKRPATMPTASGIQQAAAQQQGAPDRRVQPVAFDQRAARSNQEVAQNIAEALTSAGLSGYDIEVRYKNGAASLIGNVEDPSQAARAHQATSTVPGVNQVLNQLTVKGQVAAGPGQGQPQFAPRGPQGQMPPGYGRPSPQQMQQQMQMQQHIQQTQGMAPQGPPPGMQGPPPGYAPGMQGPPPNHAAQAGHQIYNQPNMPDYAWPTYAAPGNYSAVTYPSQYDASAFPYIGPYHPYPQVPLGWRSSTLEWDDGSWNLTFDSRTDRWWWFMNPKNW